MNPAKILRLASLFYSLASSEELPENSKDKKTALSNIEKLETYAARKKYAEKNFKRLSSGSSRLVYLTNDKTVIKLASNDKGVAQNKAEANPKMKSKYLNPAISCSKNYSWIETHFLDKITVKDFKEMTDIEFEDFGQAMSYGLKDLSSASNKKKPNNFEKVSKSPIYKELKRVAEKFELLPGDISRISSWGCKGNNPVLIDSGLTRGIFDKYYEESSS